MINLLPETEIQKIKKDYRYRVALMGIYCAVSLLVLNLILMIPSFIIANIEANYIPESAKISEDDKAKFEELLVQSEKAKKLINLLKPVEKNIKPSKAIDIILANRTFGSRVSGISYEVKNEVLIINVRGIASSRKDLLDFTNSLKKQEGIASVSVPISNFTKESEIPFSFGVEIKSNEK